MWRDEAYFLDILEAAQRVQKFAAGVTWEEFERDDLLQSAIMMQLMIIGEAAGKVSQQNREAHTEIPWHSMTGMRNRLIHEYFRINLQRVWDTIQNDIPGLITLLEPLIPPQAED